MQSTTSRPDDLEDFVAEAERTGVISESVARSYVSALRAVVRADPGLRSLNLLERDLDDVLRRFKEERDDDINEKSYRIYRNRFAILVEAYREYTAAGPVPAMARPRLIEAAFESAQAAHSQSAVIRRAAPSRNLDVHSKSSASREVIAHRYPLRKGMVVRLEIPTDLTPSEAERISAFVRSLVVEH